MTKRFLMTTAALALASAGAASAQMTAVGDGEGQVDIVAWPGYIERGETDKAFDWVTKFEEATGCKVNKSLFGRKKRSLRATWFD